MSPQNSHSEILSLDVMVLGGGAFGRWLGHEGAAHMNGIGSLIKESHPTPQVFPWASQVVLVIKNLPASAEDIRDMGSIPGSGGSLGEGYGNPLQHSCVENPMDRGAWQAIVHGITKSLTWLKQFSKHKSSLAPSTMWGHRVNSCLWIGNPYQTQNLPVPQSWTP